MPRPASYDRTMVVEQATLRFWEDGFAECDVETLTRAAGVNRHSLYKAFGGKSGLFLSALDHYLATVAAPYIALLEGGAGLDELVAYFEIASGVINRTGHGDIQGYDRRGCFITNTVAELGRSQPEVSAIVDGYYDRVERAFAGLIARGQAAGSIRADLDPGATSRWLLLTSQGMSVASRMGAVATDLPNIIRAALAPLPA
ncbi:TetR/AcrR family transcriptional regulator [Sphingomonas sp. KC8]|uniref:TetR/AcrR family transcriptional regulator n=1 Tax=Sphingomonas sp. KC8 TaxID=1030157 RepID=UPI000248A07B|nr:TetR/AcrR family transcriptional regulator [Sphingomonas sp. KC8]ARS27683.1 putative transcriptional regulator [Sphingomonas sp. KC8]